MSEKQKTFATFVVKKYIFLSESIELFHNEPFVSIAMVMWRYAFVLAQFVNNFTVQSEIILVTIHTHFYSKVGTIELEVWLQKYIYLKKV